MPPKKETELTFTEASDALDEIIGQFKSGNLALEDSLALFETGVKHLKTCQSKLTQAQGKVEELVKTLQAQGESLTREFEA